MPAPSLPGSRLTHLGALLLLVACGDTTAPRPARVTSVTLSPASSSVAVGTTTQLAVVIKDAKNNVLSDRVVTWASINAAVASVSSTGLVTGITIGATTVTVTCEGISASSAMAVTPPPVASVSVTPAAVSVGVGGTAQLSAKLRDASGVILTDRQVTWSTSNALAVSVSSAGVVTAVALGQPATVTATSEGRSGTATVIVLPPLTSTFGRVSVTRSEVDTREPTGCLGGSNCYVPRDASNVFVRVSFLALDRLTGPPSSEFNFLLNSVSLSGTGFVPTTASVVVSYVSTNRFYLLYVVPGATTTSPMRLTWPGNAPLEFLPSATSGTSSMIAEFDRHSPIATRFFGDRSALVEAKRLQ